jgi:WD40 repeat protein
MKDKIEQQTQADIKDFFISYHSADRPWAEWIAWQLEEEGYTTIIQAWDFRPGSNFTIKMDKALRSDIRTITILSPSYLSAFDTHSAEWATAFNQDPTGEKGILLPVRVSECKPGGLFGSIGYIDLVGKYEQSSRQELLAGVVYSRNKPYIPPVFPGVSRSLAVMKPDFPGEHAATATKQRSSPPLGTIIFKYELHSRWVNSVAWSPDGTRIASSGGDGIVQVWDSCTGHNFSNYKGHIGRSLTSTWQAQWSPDGKYIASSGYGPTVHVWDSRMGKAIVIYRDHSLTVTYPHTFTLVWSPDGKHIASACSGKIIDHTIHVWNALTGRTLLTYSGHAVGLLRGSSFFISALAWSPNGQYIASGGSDKNIVKNRPIQIWKPETGQTIITCGEDSGRINSIAWSPDSCSIASANGNKNVGIWDARTGENIFSYNSHRKRVNAVAWSPDGSRIASASSDQTVHIWNALTGQLLFIYRGHTDVVATVAWSPDGSRIASAGADKTVQIWRAI